MKADKASNLLAKETARKVEARVKDLDDEVCPDEIYQSHSNLISLATQTLECGVAQTAASKSVFDYYTLRYDDSDD